MGNGPARRPVRSAAPPIMYRLQIPDLYRMSHRLDVTETLSTMRLSLARSFGASTILFAIMVILPTTIAILYYGLLASDVYVSESRIVVRAPDKPAQSPFGALLKTAGFTNASEEVYAVTEYVGSRDAVRDANRSGLIRRAYENDAISIFDRLNGFGFSGSFEDMYSYFVKRVTIKNDSTSSVLTLTVRAYSAKDAQKINEALLDQSERLINRLNTRGRRDLIEFAQREANEAAQDARRSAATLAAFRNRTGTVDPEKQAQIGLEMVSKLQDELIASQVQLQQLRRLAPDNPQVPQLAARIAQLQQAMENQMGKVAGSRTSLAANAAEYQRLQIDNEISGKRLAAAMTSLQEAQNEARRKQVYVERIVTPNLADEAIEPRRLAGVLAVFALALIAWGIANMLIAGVREHAS
jgi:capsular polysaccharide transport system permease protein